MKRDFCTIAYPLKINFSGGLIASHTRFCFALPTKQRADGGIKPLTGFFERWVKFVFAGKDFFMEFERIGHIFYDCSSSSWIAAFFRYVPMNTEVEDTYKRTLWQSRRGMLELDLLLMPFCQKMYPMLSKEEQVSYRELMTCEDTQLYAWLMGFTRPDSLAWFNMIQKIRDYAHGSVDTTPH